METKTPVELRKILVAYDGSKDSGRAIDFACSLAGKYSSELLVVHCYITPTLVYGAVGTVPVPNYDQLEAAAKERGNVILKQGLEWAMRQGVKTKGELLGTSSVLQALLEFASNEKVDLIVAGTRGMTGFKKLILGSVSSGLVSHAACPVLVVR
jgi:nucleotide-binding universal stress UspA family protein